MNAINSGDRTSIQLEFLFVKLVAFAMHLLMPLTLISVNVLVIRWLIALLLSATKQERYAPDFVWDLVERL